MDVSTADELDVRDAERVAAPGAFVVAMCLFPLARFGLKVILYVCLAILGTFAVVFTVRTVVFVAVWIVSGEHFWILPNLTARSNRRDFLSGDSAL